MRKGWPRGAEASALSWLSGKGGRLHRPPMALTAVTSMAACEHHREGELLPLRRASARRRSRVRAAHGAGPSRSRRPRGCGRLRACSHAAATR
eukprot:6359304-Prymnesium_polylepis.1